MRSILASFLIASSLLSAEPTILKKIVLVGDPTEHESRDIEKLLEESCLGEPITDDNLQEIQFSIRDYYENQNSSLVDISTPDQEVTNGVLTIQVDKRKLGEIRYRGNKWYRTKQLSHYVRQESGDPIDVERLSEDLAWMNRSPFRRSDALFVPGKDPHTTDIELATWDRMPVRFYGGFDNRGNDAIGTERMFGGLEVGNFLNFDVRMSYQYTCSLSFGNLNAHVLRFDIPLPWRHLFNAYYGYSRVHLKHLGSEFLSQGTSQQASGRYVIATQKNRVLDWTFGYDYKLTNNNLLFAEIPIFSNKVAIGQFLAGITYQSQPGCNVIFLNLELVGQPGGYLPHMKDFEYQTLRPFAKNVYLYGRGAFEYTHRFARKEFSLINRIGGQASTANLLPSEEFGLGGADTVRGYKERIVNGDDAIAANLEFRWDAFCFLRKKIECPTCCDPKEQIYQRRKLGDLFSLLAFIDYGFTHVHKNSSLEQTCAYLLSAGPGVRYVFDQYVQARLDWGIQLHKIEAESFGSRLHFSLVGSY